MKLANALFSALLLAAGSAFAGEAAIVRVDPAGDDGNDGITRPLASVQAAQRAARSLAMAGRQVTVALASGRYRLQEALRLGPEDGGITWSAEPGAVLDGAVALGAWTVDGDGRWRAPLPADGFEPQQLVVGERWQDVACAPDGDQDPALWRISAIEAALKPDPAPAFQALAGAAVVLAEGGCDVDPSTGRLEVEIIKDWATSRYRIAGIADSGRRLLLADGSGMDRSKDPGQHNKLGGTRAAGFHLRLRGHPSLISRPGEWAVDPHGRCIVYMPMPGQLAARDLACAPRLASLVLIEGDALHPVRGLRLQGLRCVNAAWSLPAAGLDGNQAATAYGSGPRETRCPPCAVSMRYVQDLRWSGGGVERCGGSGLGIRQGCRDVVIEGLLIADCGANGVMIGTFDDPGADGADLVRATSLRSCLVERCGRELSSAVGVWVGIARQTELARNEIRDLPYTGISMGWKWNQDPGGAAENRILGNHVHDVMQALGDGGGIYTLGAQPGSRVEGNLVHGIRRSRYSHASPNNGIYHDEGSTGFTSTGNLVFDTVASPIRIHHRNGTGVAIIDNVLAPPPRNPPGFCSPPYTAKGLAFTTAGDHADSGVAWGENRVLDAAAWTASGQGLLAEWTGRCGPEDPWRALLARDGSRP